MEAYIDALALEARGYQGSKVKTIYLGGGTPSFLPEKQLKRLFDIIKMNFVCDSQVELTIESNPEGLDMAKARLLKSLGVNRISLGVQSLNDKYLKYLGRNHNADLARGAFKVLREAGFDNINLDLMYGFPKQTLEDIERDIDDIVAWGSEHLSIYTLTIEEKSRLHALQTQLPEGEVQARQYLLVVGFLERLGFKQYEISNFSKPGRESKHNLNYWRGGNYIGLGIGAHSHQDGHRFWNIPKLTEYIHRMSEGGSAIEGEEFLEKEKRLMELVLFGLRMKQGINLKEVEAQCGHHLGGEKRNLIGGLVAEGFLSEQAGRLIATEKGRLVLDEISARLI